MNQKKPDLKVVGNRVEDVQTGLIWRTLATHEDALGWALQAVAEIPQRRGHE